MKHLKYFKLNEGINPFELEKELKNGATWIEPAYIGKDHLWGVIFYKDNVKREEGVFNTPEEVHRFLERIGVDYKGMEGWREMSKFREKETEKLPFQNYQRYLLEFGLKDFDLE